MSRRKARILAVQALYSYEIGGADLDRLLSLDWVEQAGRQSSDENSEEDSAFNVNEKDVEKLDFARILIAGTVNHIDEVDSMIKAHLSEKWEFGRVNKVSVAILRVSVYSLMFQSEISATVIIDEAIGIAKEYGTDDSFKFINAVLDNIRKDLEKKD